MTTPLPYAVLVAALLATSVSAQDIPAQHLPVRQTHVLEHDALTGVRDLVMRDGTVFVVSGNEVWSIEARDTTVARVARTGQGPGEVSTPTHLGWIGDSLWIRDVSAGHVLVLHDGREVRRQSVRYPVTGVHEFVRGTVGSWILSDGSVLAPVNVMYPFLAMNAVDSVPLLRAPSETEPPGPTEWIRMKNTVLGLNARTDDFRQGGMFLPQPFADTEVVDVPADGDGFILLDRRENRVQAHGPDGTLRWTARLPSDPRSPAGAQVDEVVAGIVAEVAPAMEGAGFASETALRDAIRDGLYVPDHVPPATALVAAVGGGAWVRRTEDSGRARWDLLDPGGAPTGWVDLPAEFQGFAADATSIWGVVLTTLDVPTLVRYAVDLPP